MSTELGDFAGIGPHPGAPHAARHVSVTRFFGGSEDGHCVQLTVAADAMPPLGIQYVQMTRDQWLDLRAAMDDALVPPVAEPQGAESEEERITRAFHDAYERLAPEHGYSTREASAKPWEDVPETNKRLMLATVASLLERGVIAPSAVPQWGDGEGDDVLDPLMDQNHCIHAATSDPGIRVEIEGQDYAQVLLTDEEAASFGRRLLSLSQSAAPLPQSERVAAYAGGVAVVGANGETVDVTRCDDVVSIEVEDATDLIEAHLEPDMAREVARALLDVADAIEPRSAAPVPLGEREAEHAVLILSDAMLPDEPGTRRSPLATLAWLNARGWDVVRTRPAPSESEKA